MKVLAALLVAAATLTMPAAARPNRDPGPWGNSIGTDQTVRIVLTRLDLGRSQRDKVYELIGDARNDARNIERNRRLTQYQRQDRLAHVSTKLRSRVIHVLNRDQKDRLRDILAGDRNDGPRYRRNDDRRGNGRDYRSRGNDRDYRSRDDDRRSRSRDDDRRGNDSCW